MNLNTSDDDGTVGRQLADLRAAIRDVMTKSNDITRNIRAAEGSARDSYTDVQRAREAIDRAEKTLKVSWLVVLRIFTSLRRARLGTATLTYKGPGRP